MTTQVDASTVRAGGFLSASRMLVPDYQRKYSWTVDRQIADFWRDLAGALGRGEYFLGLVILADGPGRQEIVDGQQRLVTLTILANALRLFANRLGRRLVSESLRNDFLQSVDFETEIQVPRLQLTDQTDRDDLAHLLSAETANDVQARPGSAIHDAHLKIWSLLESDLLGHGNPALRVGQWTEFITNNLTFAVFMHPDRAAAFRVYEVVNTRGKALTPAELIKSYLIGNSAAGQAELTHRRWGAIEETLDSLNATDQLTTLVRHVVTLEVGYVIPRELYEVVSTQYAGPGGVSRLLDQVEHFLPIYTQLIDPAADVESSEAQTRAFVLASFLSLARFRPIFLVAAVSDDPRRHLAEVLDLLVPGALASALGSGSVEAQFARAARRLVRGSSWAEEIERLHDLKPSRQEFELRASRSLNKAQAHVARCAYLQSDPTPHIEGFPHQVRPRNAEAWEGFDAEQYRAVGGTVGNWVLATVERRPQGTRTPDAVRDRIVSSLIPSEVVHPDDLAAWTASEVIDRTSTVVERIAGLWYGD